MTYQDTPNKSLIRNSWDLPILSSYSNSIGRRLAYLGLPGVKIHDLLDWKDVLGYRTAVEFLQKSGEQRETQLRNINRLQMNVMLHDLDSNWQILRGNIEDVILDGYDLDGMPPALNDGAVPYARRYEYDVYNLDFFGGLGYADMRGESKRIRALRKLLERQKGHSFLLLLTINVRDTVGNEISAYLEETALQHRYDVELFEILSWYSKGGRGQKKYKLKAAVPLCLQEFGRSSYFSCYCYPPVVYQGHKRATMVHYVFRMNFVPNRNFPVPQEQEVKELLSMPLVEAVEGSFQVCAAQHPGYQFDKCFEHLNFLDDRTLLVVPSVATS